jgi:hypothetical protein
MLRHLAMSPAMNALSMSTDQLIAEKNPAKVIKIKNNIVALFRTNNANLLTPFQQTTVLDVLMNYYDQAKVQDTLYELLIKFYHAHQCKSVCEQLLQQRWSNETKILFTFLQQEQKPEKSFLNDSMILRVVCNNLSEATLVMNMLESVLYENYSIPYRASTKCLDINFKRHSSSDEKIQAIIYFTPSDYLKITGPPKLNSSDKLLEQIFSNPKNDYYDYFQIKYDIPNTREIIFSPNVLTKIDFSIPSVQSQKQINQFSGRMLIITRTGLGSGNYINARLTIDGLCKLMPLITIDWVVANDGDPLPSVKKLPPQVTFYETDTLWKLYPLIRALSIDADVVASLPNNFLVNTEQELLNTPLTLSEKSVFMMVNEYNSTYSAGSIPSHYLDLRSGIDVGKGSTGIIIPDVLELPSSLADKRALLCQSEKASQIFVTNPDAPLYFAYVYHPKAGVLHSTVTGINIIDVLALFIQHAKRSKQSHIKALLPIDVNTVQEAMRVYPSIFRQCTLRHIDSRNHTQISDDPGICVEIYHLFPYDNNVFRQLMDYAAAHNTPVVTTGDQSFMELFFTITNGFVFLYQLLEHKKDLLDQIKLITIEKNLPHLNNLIAHTEHRMASEHDLMKLTDVLISKQDELKQESLQLMAVIKAQPNLIDSLAHMILDSVTRKQQALATAKEASEKDEDEDEVKRTAVSFA